MMWSDEGYNGSLLASFTKIASAIVFLKLPLDACELSRMFPVSVRLWHKSVNTGGMRESVQMQPNHWLRLKQKAFSQSVSTDQWLI
jgi:hypothetical protein